MTPMRPKLRPKLCPKPHSKLLQFLTEPISVHVIASEMFCLHLTEITGNRPIDLQSALC